jgi:hypothetical protein
LYVFKAVIGLVAIVYLAKYSLQNNSYQLATLQFMGGIFDDLTDAYLVANPAKRNLHKTTVLR